MTFTLKKIWEKIGLKTMVTFFAITLPLSSLLGQDRSFLWKIEYQGQTGYLLGSVHALKKENYPLKPSIELAFTRCQVLAVEADISDLKSAELAMKMMQQGTYTDNDTIENHLSPQTIKLLHKQLTDMGMSETSLSNFKPWMAAMFILQAELMKIGFNPNLGIDKYFLDKAAQKNLPIAELEGAEFQMNMLTSLNAKENDSFLRSTIEEANQLKTQLDKLINAWTHGNITAMEELMTAHIKKDPDAQALYRKINDDRNIGMVQKIESYLASGKPHFIIAGAMHMIGPKGVVQLLINKGYKVTQL